MMLVSIACQLFAFTKLRLADSYCLAETEKGTSCVPFLIGEINLSAQTAVLTHSANTVNSLLVLIVRFVLIEISLLIFNSRL